jgi:outer membrane receptor protein involved in Fe transport
LGINTTVLFNQIGRRILYVGNDQVPEIWENPRPLLDLQVAKKLIKDKAEIKLNVSNILNRMAYYYHDMNNNKKFDSGAGKNSDAIAVGRNYGTNFSLSFNYKFK